MKKFFAFAAALMMLSASAETLSLYDGSSWSSVVPFNGLYMDEVGTKGQVLYPAADLTDMVGKEITAITFYTEADGCPVDGVSIDVSLGETDATVMTGYVTDGMTKVGSYTFTPSEGVTEITITFDTPYTYNGGNLVFEDIYTAAPKMYSLYMTGIETDYNCAVSWSYGSATLRQFLPKTTFTYGGDTPEPQFLRGDVDNNGEVKIGDVTALISYLLSGDATGINLLAADCDQNGEIKIGDVTALISYLLSGSWE